jgi:hypothetical protein
MVRLHPALLALFLVGFLLLLLVSAPARLIGWFLADTPLAAAGLNGRLWQGSAASVALQAPAGPLQLGAASWSLSPLSLLTLSPRVDLETRWGSQQVSARVELQPVSRALRASEVTLSLPAALLRQFLPLDLDGEIGGRFDRVEADERRLRALDGQLTWRDAAWRDGARRFALGSYAVEFSTGSDGGLRGEVLSLSGPLIVEGEIGLDRDGRYRVDLSLESPQEPLAPEPRRALSLLAAPEGDGFRLRLQGALHSPS